MHFFKEYVFLYQEISVFGSLISTFPQLMPHASHSRDCWGNGINADFSHYLIYCYCNFVIFSWIGKTLCARTKGVSWKRSSKPSSVLELDENNICFLELSQAFFYEKYLLEIQTTLYLKHFHIVFPWKSTLFLIEATRRIAVVYKTK